jgi:stearoyl-CoA desaturase (Delta-9 desaturase)
MPYRHISPTENPSVALFALGEGWHNYHHTFPWDYKAAELGNYGFNYTTWLIDLSHSLGLAYDLKFASNNLVHDRVLRTGGDTSM